MERIIIIFGNPLPEKLKEKEKEKEMEVISLKAQNIRKYLIEKNLGHLQTTIFVSKLHNCYKRADIISELLYGNRRHRSYGHLSEVCSPKMLADQIQDDKQNFHKIVVVVVSYSNDELLDLLKRLGFEKESLALVSAIDLKKDVIYLDQEKNQFLVF